jgi:hypothetical protein
VRRQESRGPAMDTSPIFGGYQDAASQNRGPGVTVNDTCRARDILVSPRGPRARGPGRAPGEGFGA